MIDRRALEEIVIEVLNKMDHSLIKKENEEKPNLLVVNASDVNQINQLEKHCKILKIPTTSEWIPANVHEVVLLHVTQDLLVKGAMGITDTPESEMLAKALLQGLKIHLIPSYSLEWLLDPNLIKTLNQEYIQHLLSYKKRLETFGAHFLSFENLILAASVYTHEQNTDSIHNQLTFRGKLLTQRDIEKIKDEKIYINRSTIVTPLARDVARELRKNINVID